MSRLPLLWVAGVIAAASLGIGAPAQALSLASGLEAYWQFDGNGTDSSGQGRDVTLAASPTFGTGLFGQALSLPGSEALAPVRPVNDAVFNFAAGDFTIQAWLNFSSTAGEQVLIEKFTGGSGPGWTFTKLSDQRILFFGASSSSNTSVGQPILTSTWHHFVARRLGNQLELFFDGSSLGTVSMILAITDTTNPLLIGAREGSQVFPLNGMIDEYAIWSRGLSDTDIGTLYNNRMGTIVPEPASIALLALGLAALALRRRLSA